MTTTTRDASPVSLPPRPALDGIRAVAVLAVIAAHTVGAVPGGYLGVDAFFALSGYLITSLLVAEWHTGGTISLGRFWARRARRLLPALFLMLTGVAVGAALWPGVLASPSLRGDTVATVLQVANWHLIAEHANYFVSTGRLSPLLHTWSLAIEEQFYLLWPIVVLGVLTLRRPRSAGTTDGRRRLAALFALSAGGAVASALWMAVHAHGGADVTRSYYASDTRAQAILVGAALAVAGALWGPARSPRARSALQAAGVVGAGVTALLWVLVPPDSLWAFRGGFFIAALGTAGVIAAVTAEARTPIGAALAWGPVRYVGRISYGMYLWYWPLVLVLSGPRTHLTGLALLVVRVAVIVAVATASAYLVELPIRHGHLPAWWAPLAMPTAAGLAVLTTFLATVGVSPVAAASAGASAARSSAAALGVPPSTEPVKVLIVGDSLAGTLGVGLGRVMARYGVVAVNEGSPGCSVSMDQLVRVLWFTVAPGSPCQDGDPGALLAQWKAWVDQFNPDVVVYLARSDVLDQEQGSTWTHLGDPAFDAHVTARFRQALAVLGRRGAHVVLLTTPMTDTGVQPSGSRWPEDDPGRVLVDNGIIHSLGPATTVMDVGSWLSPGGKYAATVDGIRTRCDDGVHLTVAGGAWVAQRILPEIALLGRPHQEASPTGTWSGDIALSPPAWYATLPCGEPSA